MYGGRHHLSRQGPGFRKTNAVDDIRIKTLAVQGTCLTLGFVGEYERLCNRIVRRCVVVLLDRLQTLA
jgi:hypothetical protein